MSGLNVFVGANNVGKSTILEAVFMLVGMANPIMPMRVNYSRTQTNSDMDSLKYLFHNIDFNNQPLLKAKPELLYEDSLSLPFSKYDRSLFQ